MVHFTLLLLLMTIPRSYGYMHFNERMKYLKSSSNFMPWLRGNQARSWNVSVLTLVVNIVDLSMLIANNMILHVRRLLLKLLSWMVYLKGWTRHYLRRWDVCYQMLHYPSNFRVRHYTRRCTLSISLLLLFWTMKC